MSEYEMATLFYQVVEAAHAALANYLTVVFAVLVVSYFVANKLNRVAWICLLGVYSIFAIGMTNEIVSLYSDMVRLGWQMASQMDAEKTALSWHGMASGIEDGPRWAIPIVVAAMCGLAYVGSIIFFFQIRKRGSPGLEL